MQQTAERRESIVHFLKNKEAYLESFDQWYEGVHEGPAAETGVIRKGSRIRKEACEDVKLSSEGKGLHIVADGVSTAAGWIASREVARVMWDKMGEDFDEEVENIAERAKADGRDVANAVDVYIRAQMKAAVSEAEQRVKALETRPNMRGSATTLSMVKIVDMPGGEDVPTRRAYITNIGDSRVYLQRGGELHALTRDDSYLQRLVDMGEITSEDAQYIDQHPNPRGIEDERLRRIRMARRYSTIFRSIGVGSLDNGVDVNAYDLQPEDRLLLVSDGVSDQVIESRMKHILDRHRGDHAAEQALQQEALAISLEGTDARAKGDDISALVITPEVRGPSRAYLHPETQETGSEMQNRQSRVQELHRELIILRQNRQEAQARLRALKGAESEMQQEARVELAAAQVREAYKEAQLEQAQLNVFAYRMPRRFGPGDAVKMWREDLQPRRLDDVDWTVESYDPRTRMYNVSRPGGGASQVSRYALESRQPTVARSGDLLEIQLEGRENMNPLWQILNVNRDQGDGRRVVMTQEMGEELHAYARVDEGTVELQAKEALQSAERGRVRMMAALKAYEKARGRFEQLSQGGL